MSRVLILALLFAAIGASADEDGRYKWVVLTTVKKQVAVNWPAYCSDGRTLCMDAFFDVSLRIEQVLGSRSDPAPKTMKGTNHYGEDPFLSGRDYRYLLFSHNYKDIPRVGVSLRVLKTKEGKLAVPVTELLPWWENSGCDAFVHEMAFAGPKQWLKWHLGPDEKDWDYDDVRESLKYGVRDGEHLVFTKGVYVSDLAIGAKALRIGCTET